MKEKITEFIKKLDTMVYPNTFIPIYQVLSGFAFGLFFGAFHKSFLWSLVSYSFFEYLIRICLKNRKSMYIWKARILAITFSVIGIIFSKTIWGSRPIFQFFIK